MVIRIISISILTCIYSDVFSQSESHDLNPPESGNYESLDYFLHEVRIVTTRYKDLQQAMMDGYIKFGPDMPNMGNHYVLPAKAVSRDLNFREPSVLTYLQIGDQNILTGVAYTYPVTEGQPPPDLPFEQMKWHSHAGNLEMEAHGIHDQNAGPEDSVFPHLAMVHAWIWSNNQDGIFSANHWGLSFLRLGLKNPPHTDPDASRALFMLFEGVEYYTRFVELVISPSPEVLNAIKSILSDYAIKVEPIAAQMKERDQSQPYQSELKSVWDEMWREIRKNISEADWDKIQSNLIIQHNH